MATSGTILTGHTYAWSNNVGYINFKDTIVSDSGLSGYAWSTNNGWIKMSPTNGGVVNNGQGSLSGYAWGEGLGWINFSGVTINSSGVFTGTASGDIVGTLTFGCAHCDVQTDWRVTPSGGGGGPISTPTSTPTSTPPTGNPPTGSIQINNGAQYTNNKTLNLSFVEDNADSYAVSLTNNFSTATYTGVVSSTQFTLSVGEGVRTLYVSFKNQYGIYVTSGSIILDTIPPGKPTIALADSGVENGKRVRPTKITGSAEANSQVVISKVTLLAGDSTYYSSANSQGVWDFTFSGLLSSGNYILSARAQDSAGNLSVVSDPYELVVPVDQVPIDNPPDNGDTTTTTDGNTDNTDTNNTDTGSTGGISTSTITITTSSSIPVLIPVTSSTPATTNITQKVVEDVTDGIKSITVGIGKNVVESGKQASQAVANLSKKVEEKVRQVVNNPQVESVNKQVVTPVVATVAVVNVASSGFGLLNVVNFLRLFFGQFLLLFRRRKQRKWGVLYNSFTKKPIDLASVRLIDLDTNRIVRSVVTDLEGRYILGAKPGNYKIVVSKSGYEGFSEHLKSTTEDSTYINLYHGENIKVTDESEINYNIPLDPIEVDKNYLQIIKDKTHKSVRFLLSTVGLYFSVISFVFSPVWWIGLLVIFQFLLYMIVRRFSYSKLPSSFGVITMLGQEKPLPNVAVRVFDAAFNKLVETTVTDRKGRYAVLLGPSRYYATYEKDNYEKKKSPLLDFSSRLTEGLGGILVRDEALEKMENNKI